MPDLPSRPAGGPLVPPILAAAVTLLAATWRVRHIDGHLLEEAVADGAAVLAFWHGEQLIMVPTHARRGFHAMASLSRDGELLAQTITRLGYGAIRGSSSRGGGSALKQSVTLLSRGVCPALAVDGPRGPRFEPHPGVLIMAARTSRPIVYGVAHARPALHLRSWDRFEIPAPFARVEIAYGRIEAPVDDAPETIEKARQHLGERMRATSEQLRGGVT
ncbi:MAG: lysophospholipid acyltransferase (LPLAT)-like uncharacterized protein [Myxococcota bacterium]|jgi:lysophospholipid acyltransferase (LPLAT)-like uncharacterized protein